MSELDADIEVSIRDDLADLARSGVADAHYDSSGFRDGYCLPLDGVARLLVERERVAAAQAWDEGYAARAGEDRHSPGESNPYTPVKHDERLDFEAGERNPE